MQGRSERTFKSIARTAMMVMLDVVLINLAMILSMQLQHDMAIPMSQMRRFSALWPIMTAMCLAAFAAVRLYHNLWEYASIDEVIQIALGTLIGVGCTVAFSLITYQIQPVPNRFLLFRSTYLIDWFILTFLMLISRFSVRLLRQLGLNGRSTPRWDRSRVMVLGAGWAGASAIRELAAAAGRKGTPVVVLDDDRAKANTRIGRVPVRYGIDGMNDYIKQYRVDEIVVALPSAPPERMRQIIGMCVQTKLKIKVLPGLRDVTDGQMRPGPLREVNIADLLFRDEVKLDIQSICGYLQDKVVLVTGGGGSIGSELCRQIAKFNPAQLLVFDIYENNAYDLVNELKRVYGGALNVKVVIGSVRDERRLEEVFSQYRPDVVFHAAA
ncbi:MAG: polysaccharide biosynthesis protein, partial [Clostridiales bacterium]|nr:polysaccharide biosynthesis protein [Clostridiales bacterium]